jgi:hypothetical protein
MDDLKACILGGFAAMFFASVIALIVHEVRKGPPKFNRRIGLPPPSDACRRVADWQTQEPRSPRGYVP